MISTIIEHVKVAATKAESLLREEAKDLPHFGELGYLKHLSEMGHLANIVTSMHDIVDQLETSSIILAEELKKKAAGIDVVVKPTKRRGRPPRKAVAAQRLEPYLHTELSA